MITKKVILSFENVFKNEDYVNYLDKLNTIPQNFLFEFSTHFLNFEQSNPLLNNHTELIKKWFSKETNFTSEINNIIEDFITINKREVVIINPRTSLTIFENALQYKNEIESNLDDFELEVLLFKIYLSFNQLLNINDNKILATSEKNIYGVSESTALAIAISLPTFDITNFKLNESFITQFIRSVFLFEFLSNNINAESILHAFYEKYSIQSYNEYLKKIILLSITIIMECKSGYIDLHLDNDDDFKEKIKFLECLSVNNLEDIVDYRNVRARPLLKIDEQTYRIIFPLFVIEKMYNGLYFMLKEINDHFEKDKQIKYRQLITFNFSEKHILYKILDRTFENKFIKIPGEKITIKGGIDYYIRNGNKVFIFESKDILISAENKNSYDFNINYKDIKDKLYYECKKNKVDNKAVKQLINFIKILQDGKFKEDILFKKKSIRVYPIIIIHNRQLNILGLNRIINDWYQKELELLKEESYDISKLNMITIIDIDTLILFHEQINSGEIKFEKILDEYLDYIDEEKIKSKKFKSNDEAKSFVLDQLIPFELFIKRRYKWRLPKLFQEKKSSIFI